MPLTTLVDRKLQHVTAMPDGSWLVPAEKEGAVVWGAEGRKARTLKAGGKALQYHVVGLRGLDGEACVLTDGVGVVHGHLGATATIKRLGEWKLPGELGWHAFIDATPDAKTILVASDGRLARFGDVEKVVSEPKGFEKTFRAVALLPGAARFVVGRGDGHVELRDSATLEVVQRWSTGDGSSFSAVLQLCVLNENTVVVATDTARTLRLDLTTGGLVELETQRMKTSGLHRLPDGRLLVVGLSRRVSIFDGVARVREADLSAELGDRYVQSSALAGDTLLLACEEKGLRGLRLSDVPEVAAQPEDPGDPLATPDFRAFEKAVAERSDVTELLSRLLTTSDDYVLRSVLIRLVRAKWPVQAVGGYLASNIARVRYYAADFFGQFPAEFAPRVAELKPLLGDTDASVVAAAAWALGRIGDAVAAEWLVPLLRHATHGPRVTAALALVELGRGHDDLTAAIADGAGEMTFALLTRFWPKLNEKLVAPLTPPLVERALKGLTFDELLQETGSERADDFSPTGVDGPLVAHAWVGVPTVELLYRTALTRRWACTFENERITLVSHSAAARWWADVLEKPRSR